MESSTFRIDGLSQLQAALAKFPQKTYLAMRRATTDSLHDFEGQMQPRLARARPANTPATQGVSVRSGTLRRSWRNTTAGHNLPTLVGVASLGTKYAATLENGDTVRHATSSKYLSIPLPASRTGAGVPRVASLRQFGTGGSATVTRVTKNGKMVSKKVATGASPTFIKRARVGNGYVVYLRQGRTAKPIPIYRLKPSVSIPGHLGFFATWKRLLPSVHARFDAALARVVSGMAQS